MVCTAGNPERLESAHPRPPDRKRISVTGLSADNMDRTERFYKIDRLLKDDRPVPFRRLAEILDVSAATLKRDLLYMRDRFNAPIEYDRAANGYRFGKPRTGPRYELPGLWFSASELFVLLTTLRLLSDLQPGLLGGQVSTVVERLKAIAEEGDHSWKEIEKRIRLFHPERRTGDPAHFSMVAAGLLKRRRLAIRHYHRAEDRTTDREVSPQRLVHYRDNWYLDAYCHLREGIRSFAVDAIRSAELKDARAKEIPAAELDAYLAAGYGIFAGAELQ
jgi:predicted DNA-binding transcriptional regulator YafY